MQTENLRQAFYPDGGFTVIGNCAIFENENSDKFMQSDTQCPLNVLYLCYVQALVANEKLHYIPPHHGQHILDTLWTLGQAVRDQRVIEVAYQRMKDPQLVKRRMQPVGIMFSEYYFYLTAFLEDKTDFDNPDDLFPTIYRIDRIKSVKVLNEHFRVPYAKRFEEGEFRKRVQFMYGGRLEHIRFRYTGPSLEAVLDRLPTAQVIKTEENGWLISAEVFGKGIDMWLRSQGEYVERV